MVKLLPVLFQVPIVLSAFLLFLVQPVIAKQILPWFGGSASVWNTCLFFFQFVLLLGYAYAHVLVRWFSPRQQAVIHGSLLAISFVSLPVLASLTWKSMTLDPTVRILLLLTTTVGLPYALLSSTSPLLQAWYARTVGYPYRLFALSNAASLAGLLAYPFLIEPALTLEQQARAWSGGFILFALACTAVAWLAASKRATRINVNAAPVGLSAAKDRPGYRQMSMWVVLSALGSMALISVTSFVAQNIASIPLIWVIPLSIYLVTFVLAFGPGDYRGWLVAGPALTLCVLMLVFSQNEDLTAELVWSLPVFMGGLFFVCLYCHGELAAMKPDPIHLTTFYIMMSVGGALGSLTGSILAPLLLKGDFELPLTLTAVGVVFAFLHRRDARTPRLIAFGLAFTIAALAAGQISREVYRAKLLTRNFYSSLRIVDVGVGLDRWRRMEHGGIEHGVQYLDPARRMIPVSYYGRTSAIGVAIRRQRELTSDRRLAVGVVGLGAGAIAAYGETGDRFRFYEINPEVINLARSQFTYLSQSKAAISTALGDARLVLEAESPQRFDVLAIDAFSGDGIPMHLLTREAIQIYRKHLTPTGVLLFHVSNKFVNLQPALARLAADQNLAARIVSDDPEGSDDENSPMSASDWVLMASDPAWFDASEVRQAADTMEAPQAGPAWTDDFNNILSAVRLGGSDG